MAVLGTKSTNLPALPGSIPDTQLVLVPDPVTGELLRSTFGQMKADIVLAIGDISYLDQIIEVPQVANLPQPGEVKKIYVITGAGPDQNKQFRWGGSIYIEFPQGSGDVAGEAIIRGNADNALDAKITAVGASLAAAQSTLQNNIDSEAAARANADTLLSQQIASEKNSRTTNDNILQGLINAEGTTRLNADNALSARIDTKVDKITGMGLSSNDFTTDEKAKLAGLESSHFKGYFVNLAALQTAFPTASQGDYADVDAGAGADVERYIWDDTDDIWVLQQGVANAETAASIKTKYESNPDTNAYTDAEKTKLAGLENYDDTAINAALANKVDKVAGKQLSSEDYTPAEKTKLSGIAAGAQVNDANTTLQGNTFNGAAQLVKTDASGKLPAIDGSQLTNLPSSGGGGSPIGIASGTNTYAVACTPTVTALTTNLCIRVKFTNGNTGASTINVDGLGAIAINQGPSKALTAGIITSGQIFELYYDGTVWQLGNTQAIPSTPNKVVTTDGSGNLQATNDLIDVNSTTTEATLIAATWTNGTTSATGTPGTWVLGTTSNYLYICTGTNTWIKIPAYLDYLDIYLGTVSDSGGVKTSAQMAALYPSAVRGQYAVGTNGKYEYMGMVGWFYFANSITA